jgi:phage portal protein BeeE
MDDVQARVQASETWPTASTTMTTGGSFAVTMMDAYSSPVPRSLALSVPGVLRGITLIASTIAGLPLERVDANGRRVDLGWLAQPEAGRPRYHTTVDTITDLILDGRAYWLIHERDGAGAPRFGGVEYVALDRVGDILLTNGGHTITVDGKPVDPRNVIAFQGIHSGIRHHGARIIRTAIALEAAAKRYADTPMPSVTLVNDTGYEMDDTEIDALLTAYKTARNAEGVAYSTIKPVPTAWDAMQLQLVEARQFTNTQLANLLGLPAQYIAGAATSSGGTVSYQNVTSDARSLIDYGLKEWIAAFESRLSMSDVQGSAWTTQVTPRGTTVRVSIDALLRGNPLERAQLYAQLIPLGVLTVDEARAMEDLAPTGRTPA